MPKEVNQSQRLVERSSVSLSIIHNRRVRAAPLHKDGRFVTMDMNLLLEQLKERFDANYEGLSIASDPRNAGLRDAFFETTFQRMFVNYSRRGRDDLLFYVMWDPKTFKDVVEVIRRDAKNLPSSSDPYVLWDKTLYLNIILHEFEYQVTCSVITMRPGTESIRNITETVKLDVYPSPSERRMDKKGPESEVVFPDIMFCVDGFEEVFSSIQLHNQGEKVAVQLLATNKECRISRMVFLGAVDYLPLRSECLKKEQKTATSRLKKLSLTRRKSNSSSSSMHDLNHRYSFVKMHGPKMKGFAEMAISKLDRSSLSYSVSSSSSLAASSSSSSSAYPTESNEGEVLASHHKKHSHQSPKLILQDEVSDPTPATTPTDTPHPTTNGVHHLTPPPANKIPTASSTSSSATTHQSIDVPSKDMRQSRAMSGSFLHQSSSVSDSAILGTERSRSFSGRPDQQREHDRLSVASAASTSSRISLKERLRKLSRRKSAMDTHFPISAYLTYIKLPWHTLVDDILNGTRRRVI